MLCATRASPSLCVSIRPGSSRYRREVVSKFASPTPRIGFASTIRPPSFQTSVRPVPEPTLVTRSRALSGARKPK